MRKMAEAFGLRRYPTGHRAREADQEVEARSWKIGRIEKDNPDWTDLYSEVAS
jgi:hypothetical protein